MNAQEIATRAHAGQFRRDGVTPYITHPEKVAAHFVPDSFEWKVAWLHDTLEDTDLTYEEIKNRFGHLVAEAVRALTHRKGESYKDYIARIWAEKSAPATGVAYRVKIADIATNLADAPTERQIKKYAAALSQLVADHEI